MTTQRKKSPKNANLSQKIDEFSEMTQWEHVRNRTDTYVGSDLPTDREESLLEYSVDPPQIVTGNIHISEAVIRTFIEILSNAGDNVIRSREKKVDPGEIRVVFDGKWISVENGGICIPIQKKKGDSVYIAQKIFGQLLTSSNYDTTKPRLGAGTNGVGGKACFFAWYFHENVRRDFHIG